jgi:hypothetical protein
MEIGGAGDGVASHVGVTCDGCGTHNWVGTRYKCSVRIYNLLGFI